MDENIVEITWYGRGGQGAVVASELLADAAISEGKIALAMPEFGAERRGAPVRAYNKISLKPNTIIPRTPITKADVLVIMDPSLIRKKESIPGIKENGIILVNTRNPIEKVREKIGVDENIKIFTVNATDIALKIFRRAIVNTILVGALVKVYPLVNISSVKNSISNKFSGRILDLNLKAVDEGYNSVIGVEEVKVHGE